MNKILSENKTAVSIRMENSLVEDVKKISKTYAISISEFIRQAVEEKVSEAKEDFFFKLSQVDFCSEEESKEIMESIKNMSEEELKATRKIKIEL